MISRKSTQKFSGNPENLMILFMTVCIFSFQEARGKRPFKIWDGWRNIRKGLVVNSFEELLIRGREKLGVPVGEPVRLVLDSDGTQVEDGDYFRTLPNNTVLLLLRPGERWVPTGVDVIRAGKFKPSS